MLIEFTVGNYRSFKNPVTFSMVAANLVSQDKSLDENNVFTVDDDLKLLKSAAIYGANASGKSNLAMALAFVRRFMLTSSKDTQSTDEIEIEPFRLSTETEGQPSFFEIVFLIDQVKYRYGFEVTTERVVSEWLYYVPKKRETNLFERKLDEIKLTKKYDAEGIQKRTRKNALFLSVSAQFNVEIAEIVLDWIHDRLNIISGLNDDDYKGFTILSLGNNEYRQEIIQLINKFDLGIDGVKVQLHELTPDLLPQNMPEEVKKRIIQERRKATSIGILHKKYDSDGNYELTEEFDLENHESQGTQKIFSWAAPLVMILKRGETLVIDEFDARLHPLLSQSIVQLFNSKETNPHNAQLIFMTHDTNLLNRKIFRRDQIWFTEKNRYGATDLYSLAEYNVRNDANFENDYIKGRYGAIPYIGSQKLFE